MGQAVTEPTTTRDIPLTDLTATAEPFIVTAGQIVILHARLSATEGAQGYLGTFVAKRTFDVMGEFKLFADKFPDFGPPESWGDHERNQFVMWAAHGRKFLEAPGMTLLYLERFDDAVRVGEKVAHGAVQTTATTTEQVFE